MPADLLFTVHYNKGDKPNLPALFNQPNKSLLCRLSIEFFASGSCEGRYKQGLQKRSRKIHRPWLYTQRQSDEANDCWEHCQKEKKKLKFVSERKASLTLLVPQKSKGKRREQNYNHLLHHFLCYKKKNTYGVTIPPAYLKARAIWDWTHQANIRGGELLLLSRVCGFCTHAVSMPQALKHRDLKCKHRCQLSVSTMSLLQCEETLLRAPHLKVPSFN